MIFVYQIKDMKKLIDVPDDIISDIKKVAKSKRQSVKAYMETAIIAVALHDYVILSEKNKALKKEKI